MRPALAVSTAVALLLCGCHSERPQAKKPPPRPVLTVVVKPAQERRLGFAGTVQPRYQTDLGFRVLGRMIARLAEVGDLVKPGKTLAQLDPLVLDIAVRSSEADLAKARSQLKNTTSAEERSRTLLDRNVVSQADFDAALQSREAATATLQQAEAAVAKAREQRSYATLTADIDGVVTSTEAEVGQVVAPGKKVMALARTDVREAVVDLPETVTRDLAVGAPFAVALQADRSIATTGKVREIAPQADAATRSRRVRITLDTFTDAFRLGATVFATQSVAAIDPTIELPRAAVLERDGASLVWIVDPASKTVRTVRVEVERRNDDLVRIGGGLQAGARVVVAGVNSLSEGQVVRIDDGETR